MTAASIRVFWGVSVGLLVLLTVATLPLGRDAVTQGVFCGGLIAVLNFAALARLVRSLGESSTGALLFKTMGKFLLLGMVLFALIRYGRVEPISFLVGLSVTFFAISLVGLYQALRKPAEKSESVDA